MSSTPETSSHPVVGTPARQSELVRHTNDVLSGANVALCLVAAILFVRFYRKTSDRLFLFFAAAFGILCLNGIIFQLIDRDDESRTFLYAVRSVAFGLIIYAIVDKNLGRRSSSPSKP